MKSLAIENFDKLNCKVGSNIMVGCWEYLPDEDREDIDKELKEVGL